SSSCASGTSEWFSMTLSIACCIAEIPSVRVVVVIWADPAEPRLCRVHAPGRLQVPRQGTYASLAWRLAGPASAGGAAGGGAGAARGAAGAVCEHGVGEFVEVADLEGLRVQREQFLRQRD